MSMEMASQERALERFMENNASILVKLETLKNYFENHMNISPEKVGWGNVGNSDHVIEELDEIIDFLGIKEGD